MLLRTALSKGGPCFRNFTAVKYNQNVIKNSARNRLRVQNLWWHLLQKTLWNLRLHGRLSCLPVNAVRVPEVFGCFWNLFSGHQIGYYVCRRAGKSLFYSQILFVFLNIGINEKQTQATERFFSPQKLRSLVWKNITSPCVTM